MNRRLDNAWNLKWVYPELMTGLDMLHYVLESGLSEDKERRTSAIKAFVRTQYENDQEVRFKQIELQNKLLDLFIDVPARCSPGREDRKHFYITQLISRFSFEISDTLINEHTLSTEDSVVTPWNWTPGKVKARRYTRTKKGVQDDTATNMYRRI